MMAATLAIVFLCVMFGAIGDIKDKAEARITRASGMRKVEETAAASVASLIVMFLFLGFISLILKGL